MLFLRKLNRCTRFLILDFNTIPGVEVWAIGNEGGFLAAPVNLTALGNQFLLGLAERADIIVDFSNVPVGNYVLGNVGPDEPFGGGVPGTDFTSAEPETTGQIMQFRVVPALAADPTTPPQFLQLPAISPLPAETVTRPLAPSKSGNCTTPPATPTRCMLIPPEPWETGFKDTVVAYPGQVTRIRAQFNNPGQFVWHCHIVEHEDNEMMRPYRIGPEQPGQPVPPGMPSLEGGPGM
ncbi:multicopper oxidase domain-containing protein [Desulfoprunum benzoelyticum]|uniref:FtsP/CotA-like multicopper oxidase with cupredoxin domain n=1 Tax=Desulfoprunum benzoelyticum TaxID=1506996 RepID=A0A840UQA3_9BACT|nr:multicopper oxidase domain-containing protein [Desulfoprunum benzoelyticum]MBB5347825.1 FtsP/CotA-like multicopper oxidase with cupredoxin domain [Desulfoprunum benzoelyticum]MBM9530687.1 multicopper oxidase domain-containing protein [Desulfoprunum benzoelyticum]